MTQATRLLAHRERLGRFGSAEELDQIPGFPQELLEDLKRPLDDLSGPYSP